MTFNSDIDIYIDDEPSLNQRVTGYFGSFNTTDSYNVNFLLSSFSLKEFKLLDIASEAFKFDQVDFEEMVQRDVDTVRVQDEIIDQYLKSGKNKALFFPPLIVSVIAFDKNDKPVHQFQEIHETSDDRKLFRRWDSYFGIEVIKANKETGSSMRDKGGNDIPIHPYASKIHYDDKKVKLIVIDGQHRFYALRSLSQNQPELVKDIYLPVCIVFSPDAMVNNGGQDVMINLRSMFVTINNKAKQVSGHFLDLLNDHSIASFCIRELANSWKMTAEDSLTSKLQFLEWNQRNKSKSYQVNKQHAITSVSIIADVLRNCVFDDKKESKTFNLLDLKSKKDELETYSHSTSIYFITDSVFDIEQSPILKNLVKQNIVPSLDYLFMESSVYKIIQSKYSNALKLLDANVARGIEGWQTYKALLKEFKETNKLSPEPAKIAEKEFNKTINIEKSMEIYKLNVFQQGYIRTWAQIADFLSAEDYGVSPIVTAKALVACLEKIVFDYRKAIFDKDNPYTNLVLYDRAGKPNVTVRGKQAWTEFILAFFQEPTTLSEFLRVLQNEMGGCLSDSKYEQIKNKIRIWGVEASIDYCRELLERIEKDFTSNWRIKEFPKSFKDHLEHLLAEESQENADEFKRSLKEKADYFFLQAIDPLCSLLEINKENLTTKVITSSEPAECSI